LELVVPHLTRAIGLYIELKAYKNIANIAEGITRNSSKAMFLCDKDANILELNELGINLLDQSNYFIQNQHQLNLVKDYLNANVKTIIAENATFTQENIRCRQVLILDEGEEKLILEATPLMEKHAVIGGEVNCCLVTITPENTIDWQALSNEYRLTAKETEVSRLIYNKKRVTDIADLLSMKENTVRTHLQNIYAKLRVNTQAEFILALNMFSS
jgi:DNA-binding CsgD family transcriptional regulator